MPLWKTFLRDRSHYQIGWIFGKVPNGSLPQPPTPQNRPYLWKSCSCISYYLALLGKTSWRSCYAFGQRVQHFWTPKTLIYVVTNKTLRFQYCSHLNIYDSRILTLQILTVKTVLKFNWNDFWKLMRKIEARSEVKSWWTKGRNWATKKALIEPCFMFLK